LIGLDIEKKKKMDVCPKTGKGRGSEFWLALGGVGREGRFFS